MNSLNKNVWKGPVPALLDSSVKEIRMRNTLAMIAVIVLSAAGLVSAEESSISLHIDNPAKLNREWPIVCGLPFPKGKIKDTKSLNVIDSTGKTIPCQFNITATWLKDKSIRWLLLNFTANPSGFYKLVIGDKKVSSPIKGMTISGSKDIAIKSGSSLYKINADAALFDGVTAYVVNNQGEKAILGGADSKIETSFLAKGPLWTVIRKEGWFVTEKSKKQIARGIIWLHFMGNKGYVKIVHRLVLTEDTRHTWFKDVAIDFQVPGLKSPKAAFALGKGKVTSPIALQKGESAFIMQDDYPHFMEKGSHFSVARESGGKTKTIIEGKVCGDWGDLSGEQGGVTVVLRKLAQQFPKELTVSENSITAHLWAGRCGRELDFRAPTLVREYFGNWSNYSGLSKDELDNVPSNAQASAKTHTLWYLPHTNNEVSDLAETASLRVIAWPDPEWICNVDVISSAMFAKDEKNYPVEELYISNTFDRLVVGSKMFPTTGYLAYGCHPLPQTAVDPKTKDKYVHWWRISGLVDYHLRKTTWKLFARSGERKYFEWGENFNNYSGDIAMHHWDCEDPKLQTRKVKGGFASFDPLNNSYLAKKGKAGSPANMPFFWGWQSGLPGGSGADIANYNIQFYFTGDWHILEHAVNFGEAIKKHDFLQYKEIGWGGGFTNLRYLVGLYSINWDQELGDMARNLAAKNLVESDPNGINVKMKPNPVYKVTRMAMATLEYYRLLEEERAKACLLKMVAYQYRFQQDHPAKAYQSGSAMYYPMAYILSGDKTYYKLCQDVLENELLGFRKALKNGQPMDTSRLSVPFWFSWSAGVNENACLKEG
jgi:hypothetical protein